MAASVTILWLVAAFLGGAFSLTCFQCNTTTGFNCEDGEKPCDEKYDACHTTLTEIRQGAKLSKYLVKTCGEKMFCNQTYSMSFNSTKLYASVTCCESDKCKTKIPELKQQDKEKENKVTCPYCGGVAKCNDADKVSCYGDEKKCVSFMSNEANQPTPFTWKGCATENICSMKAMSTLPGNQILNVSFQCNHAPSLLPGLLLPAAFGLAFLKLLL
ncbi:phospholipase A2 inhibitor gamma subunit B-like isoform X2 [Pyxicephalus adspersus]|uniref:phospholipase A2 inhibitor gamma subunit B-like isoform X2 n=1 Tax=Pyxicephalus adspersus TaxID=30357 RepID=UPI003B58DD35